MGGYQALWRVSHSVVCCRVKICLVLSEFFKASMSKRLKSKPTVSESESSEEEEVTACTIVC